MKVPLRSKIVDSSTCASEQAVNTQTCALGDPSTNLNLYDTGKLSIHAYIARPVVESAIL